MPRSDERHTTEENIRNIEKIMTSLKFKFYVRHIKLFVVYKFVVVYKIFNFKMIINSINEYLNDFFFMFTRGDLEMIF